MNSKGLLGKVVLANFSALCSFSFIKPLSKLQLINGDCNSRAFSWKLIALVL